MPQVFHPSMNAVSRASILGVVVLLGGGVIAGPPRATADPGPADPTPHYSCWAYRTPLLYRLLFHGGSPWSQIARMDLRAISLPSNEGPGPWGKPELF